MLNDVLAVIVTLIFSGLSVFQLLLALGLPYAKYTYGGQFLEDLPRKFRVMSLLAIGIFIFGILLTLVRVDLVSYPSLDSAATIGIWVYAAYLALNTLMNLASKSPYEKKFMTPLSAISSVSLFIIALTS